MKNFNQRQPSNYLMNLDVNNLYDWAMSQNLPEEDFTFNSMTDHLKDISPHTITNI